MGILIVLLLRSPCNISEPSFHGRLGYIWAHKGGYFQKLSFGSKSSGITSEGLGEMFEGDSADICAGKFLLMLMGGQVNSQVFTDDERGTHRHEPILFRFLKIVSGSKTLDISAHGGLVSADPGARTPST